MFRTCAVHTGKLQTPGRAALHRVYLLGVSTSLFPPLTQEHTSSVHTNKHTRPYLLLAPLSLLRFFSSLAHDLASCPLTQQQDRSAAVLPKESQQPRYDPDVLATTPALSLSPLKSDEPKKGGRDGSDSVAACSRIRPGFLLTLPWGFESVKRRQPVASTGTRPWPASTNIHNGHHLRSTPR